MRLKIHLERVAGVWPSLQSHQGPCASAETADSDLLFWSDLILSPNYFERVTCLIKVMFGWHTGVVAVLLVVHQVSTWLKIASKIRGINVRGQDRSLIFF